MAWWGIISSGIKRLVEETGIRGDDIVAIGTTSQWSVTVPVDECGEPLMNAISWMDTRGGKYNIQLVKGFPSLQGYNLRKLLKWIDIVGYPPLLEGTDCTAHILFLRQECPEIYRQAYIS
jgi:xylulokinase